MKVTDAFMGEHAVFYAEFTQLEEELASEALDSLKARVALLGRALASHAHLEDQLLFDGINPATREIPAFDVMREEHVAIEQMLDEVATARSLETARELVREMIMLARDHFHKEETMAFAIAEQSLGREQLSRLGEMWANMRGVTIRY